MCNLGTPKTDFFYYSPEGSSCLHVCVTLWPHVSLLIPLLKSGLGAWLDNQH